MLNVTRTGLSLHDAECCIFQADATGADLNYKIIVRDGAVLGVLYQEGEEVRSSPFVEHKLPPPGSFVTLPDGSLGKLQQLPRGLVVSTTPRDLPENLAVWPSRSGLFQKGKHPAELPGMVDVQLLQQEGQVRAVPRCDGVPLCDGAPPHGAPPPLGVVACSELPPAALAAGRPPAEGWRAHSHVGAWLACGRMPAPMRCRRVTAWRAGTVAATRVFGPRLLHQKGRLGPAAGMVCHVGQPRGAPLQGRALARRED